MPLTQSDFPAEVQVAFFMFDLLSDVWDGMSGTYMGKDWSSVGFIFDTYGVESRREVLYFMKMYERNLMAKRSEDAQKKQKQQEQKSSAGKNNIKGRP
jgi:hypothetical protein